MALDGIVIANLVNELQKTIEGARISKIAQPETDELLLTCKGNSQTRRLAISASASLPFVYLTEKNKTSPLQAPTFCMVLRKHIANGKILRIYQPNMERIINFDIEHLNEMGDLCQKTLVVELMGKHSNIIFCDNDGTIIDSIKHVPPSVSSVREVLPGRQYFIPATQDSKFNPLEVSLEQIKEILISKPLGITKAIYTSFVGISPLVASEIAYRAGVDGDLPIASLSEDGLTHLANNLIWIMEAIKEGEFSPVIVRKGSEPKDFCSLELTMYSDLDSKTYSSISEVLELFYAEKNIYTRIRQKSTDIRRVVTTALERNQKKYALQMKQLKDSEKKEKYKVYGELINAFGYNLEPGAKYLEAENYYDNNRLIKIPLDNTLTPMENSQRYFDKYGKMKRTEEALNELIIETKNQIDHLESIQTALDIALTTDDLVQIKEELIEYGFIKKGRGGKKAKIKSKPFHYVSSDGYDIYVGKNNYQNDELTFKFATGNDWWFHAKGMPGSHVVVKANNEELPDRTFEEAGMLAGYYSKGRNSEKVEIDYLQKKNVKKPGGAAPGFVVYYTNYSLTIHPDISKIQQID
ncbi:MAG: NFACT RNA binding domain-containing protein [Agathobacter sp.]|nr:NFACT RNA binding domain-containing protein [Agathobacter sp.]